MNGKIEIRDVKLGRGGAGAAVQRSCIQTQKGKWITVKAIVLCIRGGLTHEEAVEEFGIELADVLAAESYAEMYPQIME